VIKGVIFDLDGVLVSTGKLHYKAWKRLADELGIWNFNEADAAAQRGVSRMASLEILLRKSDKKYTEEEKAYFAEIKNGYYVEMLSQIDAGNILEGSVKFIERLKEKGILLAVGIASKNAPLILEKTGLLKNFDAVVCGLEVTHSKPDPQVFLLAAEKLILAPSECLVIEDARAGIEAALAAGMTALAVGTAAECGLAHFSTQNLKTAGEIFDDLLEIM
jgi:beta-phosphoglucomutase